MQPRFTAALDAVAPTFSIQVGKAPIGRRNATRIGFGPGLDGIPTGPAASSLCGAHRHPQHTD